MASACTNGGKWNHQADPYHVHGPHYETFGFLSVLQILAIFQIICDSNDILRRMFQNVPGFTPGLDSYWRGSFSWQTLILNSWDNAELSSIESIKESQYLSHTLG